MLTGTIHGRLVSGIGQGRHFTRLDWARRQFIERVGIDPYPGTVNVEPDAGASLEAWRRLRETPGIRIDNPNDGPHDCDARCYRVLIEPGIEAAIVLPEVAAYPMNQIELIAAVNVREKLLITDGAAIALHIR